MHFKSDLGKAAQEVTIKGKPKLVTDWAIKALTPIYFPIAKSGSATGGPNAKEGEVSTSIRAIMRQAKA